MKKNNSHLDEAKLNPIVARKRQGIFALNAAVFGFPLLGFVRGDKASATTWKTKMSDDLKVALPAGVLTGFVFPFVGVKTLKRCACVCREWQRAVDEDVLWRAQCVQLWKHKKFVPSIIVNAEGEEVPESLYPYAIYGWMVKFSVKEIKSILSNRDINFSRFLERSEFQRALALSQPRSIAHWSALYTSKWKASYVYSTLRAIGERITRHELLATLWKMEFKFNGMTAEAKFLPDGDYWSALGPLTNNNTPLRWAMVPNTDGSTFDYPAVRIGEYRKLPVRIMFIDTQVLTTYYKKKLFLRFVEQLIGELSCIMTMLCFDT